MSSFVIHLLIPVLIVLSLGIFRIRDAWVWSWAAWASDVDYLGWTFHTAYGWPNFHRALFHNVFLLALAIVLGGLAWRRWKAGGGAGIAAFAAAKPGWLLVPFFYATHLVLDLFAGGFAPFWPISSTSIFWDFDLVIDTTKPIPTPIIETQTGTVQGVPNVSELYEWMNSEQFAIFLLYLLALALTLVYERVRGNRAFAWLERRPQDPQPETQEPPRETRAPRSRGGRAKPSRRRG